jgi:hypothetical protein
MTEGVCLRHAALVSAARRVALLKVIGCGVALVFIVGLLVITGVLNLIF